MQETTKKLNSKVKAQGREIKSMRLSTSNSIASTPECSTPTFVLSDIKPERNLEENPEISVCLM